MNTTHQKQVSGASAVETNEFPESNAPWWARIGRNYHRTVSVCKVLAGGLFLTGWELAIGRHEPALLRQVAPVALIMGMFLLMDCIGNFGADRREA